MLESRITSDNRINNAYRRLTRFCENTVPVRCSPSQAKRVGCERVNVRKTLYTRQFHSPVALMVLKNPGDPTVCEAMFCFAHDSHAGRVLLSTNGCHSTPRKEPPNVLNSNE